MEKFLDKMDGINIIESLVCLVVSYLIYKIFKICIGKILKKDKLKNKKNNRKTTYIKLFENILKYVFLIITVLLILQINGVNVTSLITGLGVAGVVAGLSLQDALKDIIMGTNIITDDFFAIGDVVKYGDIEGKVISFGLKSTKIQDISTKNILTITNRNIEKIIKVSTILDIEVPASYEQNIDKVESILNKATELIQKQEHVKDAIYIGINEFADSSIIYKIRINCIPEYKPIIKRGSLKIILKLFNDNKITIPYTQIDIHKK